MMCTTRQVDSHRGFTLIEMLIVIGIIAILLGIIMTAISGVGSKARKTNERNEIRQIGNAWIKYAQIHKDRITPGWLSPSTQNEWDTVITYPDGTVIPPAPTYGGEQPNIAGPWTWRLLPYMEYDFRLTRSHLREDNFNHWSDLPPGMRLEIAEAPAYGVNGYFLGGCWDRWYGNVSGTHPRLRKARDASGKKVNLTTRSLSMMRNPSTVLAFISNAAGKPNQPLAAEDWDAGHYLATPHRLADDRLWTINEGLDVQMLDGRSGPIGRYGGPPVTWHPDGHVDAFSLQELLDQRLWIDQAEDLPGYAAEHYTYTEGD
ncbi:MAG: prepilin-type N-terminal cleavage/methylation domain-containing protein [Phycisphaerales bacterium]|nr:prepilin-type N-terminal cleavage/methylation domain-containing protein [Phycisphaerales bacterium]